MSDAETVPGAFSGAMSPAAPGAAAAARGSARALAGPAPGSGRRVRLAPGGREPLRATVRTFPGSAYDLEEPLTGLGTGEAVVAVLSERGARRPTPFAATRLRAPSP